MKSLIFTVLCILTVLQSFALKRDSSYTNARRNGAMTKLKLQIVNDDGNPVSNADVNVFMGMNFRPKGYSIVGHTDTNGFFIVEGKTCGDEINVNVSKVGFYRTSKTFRYAEAGHEHDVADGRWLPYGKTEKIILRDIRNPIEMPHEVFWKFNYTKEINTWIGYDIKENDFVVPNGKGKVADFDVYIDWNGEWLPTYRGMSVKIRFPGPFAGYYVHDMNRTSEFKSPYEAAPNLIRLTTAKFSERILDNGERKQNHFDHDKCWIVRSRCHVSPDGKLLTAHYSVIYDIAFTCKKGGYGGFCITGAFNPTPNDTNLEPK